MNDEVGLNLPEKLYPRLLARDVRDHELDFSIECLRPHLLRMNLRVQHIDGDHSLEGAGQLARYRTANEPGATRYEASTCQQHLLRQTNPAWWTIRSLGPRRHCSSQTKLSLDLYERCGGLGIRLHFGENSKRISWTHSQAPLGACECGSLRLSSIQTSTTRADARCLTEFPIVTCNSRSERRIDVEVGSEVSSIREAGDRLLTFTRLLPSQWRSARTTNTNERLHEEFKRRIKTQTVLPSADTAAMLFWALLASDQINMRKVDGWQTLTTKLIDQPIDLAA